jgi:hypothetical protein
MAPTERTLKPLDVVKRSEDFHGSFKTTAYVRPPLFAQVLSTLATGSEAVLGTLEWGVGAGRIVASALVDGNSPLVVTSSSGYELRIPNVNRLQSIDLFFFYTDGSVLDVRFGKDTFRVLRPGEANEAKARALAAQALLPGRFRRLRRWLPIGGAAMGFLTLIALGIFSKKLSHPVAPRVAGDPTTDLNTAGIWLGIVGGTLIVVGLILVSILDLPSVLPRNSRLLAAWSWLSLSLEDVRRYVVTVAGGVTLLVIGVLIGRR